MISLHKWSIYGLLILNLVLIVAIVNLGAFATKGPRYTSVDGVRERHERMTADQGLSDRLDKERQERITSGLALAARVRVCLWRAEGLRTGSGPNGYFDLVYVLKLRIRRRPLL